jgi:uncharacterized protein
MLGRIKSSPTLVRVLPFAVFAVLTLLQGWLGTNSQYWMYAFKTLLGAGLIWYFKPYIKELNWKLSWEALGVGTVVFLVWIGLDGYYPTLAQRSGNFNPFHTYGASSALGILFTGTRVLGSSLIVPPLEEVFYRSFLYRYLSRSEFLSMPLGRFEAKPFIIAGIIFGISHSEWLPGLLSAFAYQGLAIRKNRLGDAIVAHAITNLLLAIWVLTRQAYYYW